LDIIGGTLLERNLVECKIQQIRYLLEWNHTKNKSARMSTQGKQVKKKSGLTLRGRLHIQLCVKFHVQFHVFAVVRVKSLKSLFDPRPFYAGLF
jgi:hypothetical protein